MAQLFTYFKAIDRNNMILFIMYQLKICIVDRTMKQLFTYFTAPDRH